MADLTAHLDVLPTLIDLCGLQPPREVDFDGRSFKKQLFEPGVELPERILFVEKQRTLLHASDWYLPAVPWNHARVAEGWEQPGD